MSSFIIIETRHTINGRVFLQFKPVLVPDCCAEGSLSFAVWQSWEDEPHTHAKARADAIANARRVLLEMANGDHALTIPEAFSILNQP